MGRHQIASLVRFGGTSKNVRVSVFTPGGTNTGYGFYNEMRTPGYPMLNSFLASEDIVVAIVRLRPMNDTESGKTLLV